MSAPFVLFPGTSGNYVASELTNRMDADTAHLQQSVGHWAAGAGAPQMTQSTDISSKFGDYVGKIVCDGTDARVQYNAVGTGVIPLTESVDNIAGIWIYTATADREAYWSPQGYTDTVYTESYTVGIVTALTQNDWTFVPTAVMVPAAGVDNVKLRLSYRVASTDAAPPNAEVLYVSAATIQLGTTAEFVPSFSIVGDLDIRGKFAADDWSPNAGTLSRQRVFSTVSEPTAVGSGGWCINIGETGAIGFLYPNGTDLRSEQCAVYDVVNGEAIEVKITINVATQTADYYENGVWIDDDAILAGAGQVGTANLNVGAYDDQALRMFKGKAYWFEVRDGIGGPVVARFDSADVAAAIA